MPPIAGWRGKRLSGVSKAGGFAIVPKDADFRQLSFLYGSPPKVVWLRVGKVRDIRRGKLNGAPQMLHAAPHTAASTKLNHKFRMVFAQN